MSSPGDAPLPSRSRASSRAERDLSDGFARARLYAMTHPVRGGMDILAAVTALIGLIWLLSRTVGSAGRHLSIVVYGVSLIGVFVVSALYHSVPWRPDVKQFMRRLDHSMIYLLVAGTYTPISVVVLGQPWRTVTLAIVWGIAAAGLVQKWFIPRVGSWLSFGLQTMQGWIGLALLVPLLEVLPKGAVILVLIGGVLYTIGLVILVSRRPFLWPRVFSYHELMHVFVIAAAACHFTAIAVYVSPHVG